METSTELMTDTTAPLKVVARQTIAQKKADVPIDPFTKDVIEKVNEVVDNKDVQILVGKVTKTFSSKVRDIIYTVGAVSGIIGTVGLSVAASLTGDAQLLVVKSALDGVVAVVYSAAFGWGVAFSALTILVVQGGFTLLGVFAGDAFLTTRMVAELEATGGVLIAGIGLRLLELRPVRVASMLPALVVAPVLVALFAR